MSGYAHVSGCFGEEMIAGFTLEDSASLWLIELQGVDHLRFPYSAFVDGKI